MDNWFRGPASLAAAVTRLEATGAAVHQAGLEHPTLDELFGQLRGDPANMPAWLRAFANWNPMSAVVAAARSLFGTTQGVPEPPVWSLQHPVVTTLAMTGVLLGVTVPLAVRRYSRAVR